MEQYIDEYLRNIFGETLLEDNQLSLPGMKPSKKEKLGQTLSKATSSVGSNISKAGQLISNKSREVRKHPVAAATALGGLALGAGYLAHRKYNSAAARACEKYSGRYKDACMAKYRAGGFRVEMLSLKENSIICNESKNKEDCLNLIELRIEEIRTEMKKLK